MHVCKDWLGMSELTVTLILHSNTIFMCVCYVLCEFAMHCFAVVLWPNDIVATFTLHARLHLYPH